MDLKPSRLVAYTPNEKLLPLLLHTGEIGFISKLTQFCRLASTSQFPHAITTKIHLA